jgi:hypothetical protein
MGGAYEEKIFAQGEGEVTIGCADICYVNELYAVAAYDSCICTGQPMDCSNKSTPTYASRIKSNQFSTEHACHLHEADQTFAGI